MNPQMRRLGVLALAALAGRAADAATFNLSVNLSDSIRPVTHCGSGSLYGITETLPSDIPGLVTPLKAYSYRNPALATSITESICTEIAKRIQKARTGEAQPREIVDLAFDAFDKHGAGALTSWMILSGNEAMLEPIVETIHRLVDEISDGAHEDRALHDDTLTLVLLALGDALMGEPMARSLGLPRTRARDIAERLMVASMSHVGVSEG